MMKISLITLVLFLISSCSSNSKKEDKNEKHKQNETSAVDITINILKAMNDLNNAFEDAEEFDTSLGLIKLNTITPVFYDSSTDSLEVRIMVAE